MEGLAPPLKCIIELESAIQNGESVRTGVLRYAQAEVDSFSSIVRQFLVLADRGQDWRPLLKELSSPHRRALLEVIAVGLSGQSVQSRLMELREDVRLACDLEIKSHLDLLPLKMLIPLLLFQFPAFLILLFGPLLRHFIEGLKS